MKKQIKRTKHKNDGDDEVGSSSTSYLANTEDVPPTESTTEASESDSSTTNKPNNPAHQQLEQIFWSKSTNDEEKTREEEFDEYLADLLL